MDKEIISKLGMGLPQLLEGLRTCSEIVHQSRYGILILCHFFHNIVVESFLASTNWWRKLDTQ